MPMTARDFVARVNQVKATLKEGGGTPELGEKLHSVAEHLRRTWSNEQLKEALASNTEVPSDLEEAATTLYMLWMQERGGS